MNLVPWKQREAELDIFDDLEEFQRELNRLFDINLHRPWKKTNGGSFLPAVDLIDEKEFIRVKAELPGMKKDEIEISVDNDSLTIKGEKKEEKETKDKEFVRSERYYGAFNRTFSLPSGIDPQKVDAVYKDGILEIKLIKKEDSRQKQRKIEIK
ncbi:MAG: Hsp20/alpha crystallin family protein [Candidatus Omnitrophica bacterium]|nr:Hsp20/alpha crystallin family protein [Candidatus Omnitrophota bacterium]MCB9719964.1 Hsp20/alpha crystallin family protein [Candidatus Omnitrophota bacterium]